MPFRVICGASFCRTNWGERYEHVEHMGSCWQGRRCGTVDVDVPEACAVLEGVIRDAFQLAAQFDCFQGLAAAEDAAGQNCGVGRDSFQAAASGEASIGILNVGTAYVNRCQFAAIAEDRPAKLADRSQLHIRQVLTFTEGIFFNFLYVGKVERLESSTLKGI